MSDKINKIYNEIKEKLTAGHLKKITVDIINSYKDKNFKQLKKYISILKINSDINNNKLFSILIKQYHPDKLFLILKQADEIYGKNDYDKLKIFHGSYFFNIDKAETPPDIKIEFEAKYRYDKDDFGYKEKNIFEDDDYSETGISSGDEDAGFMEAVNKLYFGGLDYVITESDLKNLDGELDLSDYDISDLSGIEHCVYLNELNLSDNHIEKAMKLSSLINLKSLYLSNNLIEEIVFLENLKNLKEIDISFNNISDISVLMDLHKLEFVNLIGNPVNDYTVINRLVKKGVIVIFEHTNFLF